MDQEKRHSGRGSRIRLTRSGATMSARRSDDPDVPEGSMVSGDETSEVRR